MADEVMHILKSSSWWDGSATALCGLRFEGWSRVWLPSLSSNTKCPTCLAVQDGTLR